ncbi:MAG: DUF2971 domain-containing protein [Bacteroidales bacterium]|nr:DUF2971 domain-containing protein [Bacteroidales bacterium]
MNTTISEIPQSEVYFPSVLYKYRDWNNDFHKKIISEQTVYFAQPSDFKEDPYDCKLPNKILTKEEIYDNFLQIEKSRNPNRTRQEYRKFARDATKESLMTDENYQKLKFEEQFADFDRDAGVLCLTADAYNFEMWNKYANLHKGFCVGFDTQKMFDQIQPHSYGNVIYCDKLPKITPFNPYLGNDGKRQYLEDFCKQIISKERKWEFEKEYRIFENYSNPNYKRDRVVKLSKDCLKEIIFGAMMPQKQIDEIISICKQQKLAVEFYKAQIAENNEISIEKYLPK